MDDTARTVLAESGVPERRPADRGPVRLAAIVGALASALWCVAFFRPWIALSDADRARVQAALEPSIEAMAPRESEHAERYRILVRQIVDEGHLTGLDLYHFARTALALNRTLIGTEPGSHVLERPWKTQRALRAAAFVLAALPILSAIVALHLLAHALRRVRSPVLVLLVVLGFAGGSVALAWLWLVESISTGPWTGDGMYLVLSASIAQACAGLFAVTTKTWWRVYLGAILATASLAILAHRFVTTGALP